MSIWVLVAVMAALLGVGLCLLFGPLWRQAGPTIVLPPPSTGVAEDAEKWLKIPEQ